MPTELLYHRDPLLLSFDAVVVGHGTFGQRASVVLSATSFYPEAGGQMADRGALDGLAVMDVQVDEDGVVHHLMDAASLPAVGTRVHGVIDAQRRRQFMAQHTGQHMLSRALLDALAAETVSSRLGESVCTIDLQIDGISDAALRAAEAAVNGVIDDDRPVRAFFPSAEELASLPLRRRPKVEENIRVIDVVGYDVSPCGGTHVTHTAQVGSVRVLSAERHKGLVRVSFQAGPQAREQAFARAGILEDLGRSMSAQPQDVPAGVEKLRSDLKLALQDKKRLGDRLALAIADGLSSALPDDGLVIAHLDGEADLIRAVAARIVESRPAATALLAGQDKDGTPVVCARGAASSFDCGALLKRVAVQAGGKGGGKAESAQGRLPAGVDWRALVDHARQA